MKLRYKILGGLVILLGVGVLSLALAMSHTSACGPAPSPPAGATLMKGIVRRCYGSPAVLRYEDIAKPTAADNEVLVKVHAASVNPLDWHYTEGTPYMVRMDAGFGNPQNPRLGVDFAGTVEAVGRNVTRFKPADEVFGGKFGAFAEYVTVREDRALVRKPGNVTPPPPTVVGSATALAGPSIDFDKVSGNVRVEEIDPDPCMSQRLPALLEAITSLLMLSNRGIMTNIRISSRFAIEVSLPILEITFQSFPSNQSQPPARQCVPSGG